MSAPNGTTLLNFRRRHRLRFAAVAVGTLSLIVLGLRPSAATPVTVDFNSLARGTVVTNQIPYVTFALLGGAPVAGPITYALLDGAIAGTGNPVNVFGADGMAITPSATTANLVSITPPFYDLSISFTQGMDYFSVLVLDAEEAVSAQAFLGATPVQLLSKSLVGDRIESPFHGPVYRLEAGGIGGFLVFDRIVIDLIDDGPELYDNLTFNVAAVDEPAGVVALFLGVAAFASTRRRRLAGVRCGTLRNFVCERP